MKHITIYECYTKLSIGKNKDELSREEAKELLKYIQKEKLDSQNIIVSMDYVTFINYVGYIKLSTVAIEILPKINISEDIYQNKKLLLYMLVKSKLFNIKFSDLGLIKNYDISLYELLIKLLSEKLKSELSKGIYLEYISKEEDIGILKGKLLIKKQIKNKAKLSSKVSCEYDEFSINNKLNKILLWIINSLIKNSNSSSSLKLLGYSKNKLSDVDNKLFNIYELNDFHFNKKNKRFEEIFVIAKMLFNNVSTVGDKGKEKGFSILFKMNDLFEAYIGVLGKEILKSENISLQDSRYKLLVNSNTERGTFKLMPDIVIKKDGIEKVIIDTKWKRLNSSYNRNGVKREDMYQMYAYLTRYKSVEKVILLYPWNEEINMLSGNCISKWHIEENKNKIIEVYSVDLSNEKMVKEFFLKIQN